MAQETTRLELDANNTLTCVKAELAPLADSDVRIQVLYSGISKNDLLYLEGKHRNDFFGSEVVGKVVAVGKNVGHCKVGQTVGVHHSNQN